jgi:hypothetical protein
MLSQQVSSLVVKRIAQRGAACQEKEQTTVKEDQKQRGPDQAGTRPTLGSSAGIPEERPRTAQ